MIANAAVNMTTMTSFAAGFRRKYRPRIGPSKNEAAVNSVTIVTIVATVDSLNRPYWLPSAACSFCTVPDEQI